MRTAIKLLRVDQWVKNGFLFFPGFFAGAIFQEGVARHVLLGFAAFCLCASGIYILNDLRDVESDRVHPRKKDRPIAAGKVPVPFAWSLSVALIIVGPILAYFIEPRFALLLVAYLVMNVAYSFGLKHLAIIDITCIALGFLLRIWSGGVLAHVPITMWIEIMTFLLALFIALAKRRDDVLLSEAGHEVRKSIDGYSLEMVHASMVMIASITVVSYILYTVSPDAIARLHSAKLYYTSVFVLLGMLRYFQLALVYERSGSPTRLLLRDLPLQLIIAGWISAFVLILYAR